MGYEDESSGDEKKLSVRHTKFVNAIMSGETHTDAYLAAGYKPRSRDKLWYAAANIYRNHKVQAEIKRRKVALQEAYEEQMYAQVADAIRVRGLLVTHGRPEDSTKMRAIADTLDRAGFKPSEKHEIDGRIEHGVTITLEDVIKHDRNNGSGN